MLYIQLQNHLKYGFGLTLEQIQILITQWNFYVNKGRSALIGTIFSNYRNQ